ncbi:hypothetical protein ACVTTK_07945 [Alcaligenes nematophilus]
MTNHHISVPRVDLILAMDDLRLSGRNYSADLLNKALFSASVSAEPSDECTDSREQAKLDAITTWTDDDWLEVLSYADERTLENWRKAVKTHDASPVAAHAKQSVNNTDQVRIQDSGSLGWLDGIQCQYSIVRGDPYPNGETLAYVFEKEIADRIVETLNAASPKLSKDSVQRRAVLSEEQISAAAQCLKAEVREDKGDIVLSNVDCFIRALEQDVLRKAASQHTATLAHIKTFVACDASAISYLTLGEYRTALLKILNEAKANE